MMECNNELADELFLSHSGDDSQKDLFLTFELGSEIFGIAICNITEITGLQGIVERSNTDKYLSGRLGFHGKSIPLIDLRSLFGMPHREYDYCSCAIIIEIDGLSAGLVVDRVREVVKIPGSDIEQVDYHSNTAVLNYAIGMKKNKDKRKVLLNVQELFAETGKRTVERSMK